MSPWCNNFLLFSLGYITGNYCTPVTSIIVTSWMWIMFSFLVWCQSRISCQFHVPKIRILLIYSWVNDFRKNINKNNRKWFTNSCSYMCCSSVFTKKNLCFDRNVMCFLSLYLPRFPFIIEYLLIYLSLCLLIT